jgi:NAD(P)-dependent dehydrogenase (short-subunit alcohol dehydrogenase family)
MMSCLIVGASRGIGLELARQYSDAGDRVFASYRQAKDGDRLRKLGAHAIEVDVLQAGWVESLRRDIGKDKVDVAIIVAGVAGPQADGLVAPAAADFDAVMRTNVLVSMQLIPALANGMLATNGKLAILSSRLGSIGTTSQASWWLYRASKAAVNSVLKSASVELGTRGTVCMALHPGWVRTDMGGSGADLSIEESVTSLRRVIAAANRSHNGRFLNYTGEQLEW